MSATDELRRLLDERGVEHYDHDPNPEYSTPYSTRDTEWSNSAKRNVLYQEWPNGTTRLGASNVSPAQAIAATLGRGECFPALDSERDGMPYLHPRFVCSECGCQLTENRLQKIWQRYCPNCGRRVVEVDE